MEQAKKSVDALHQTLQETAVPAPRQESIDDITTHIERFQEDPAAHHLTLRERLEAALTEFDADHHTVSEALRLAIYDLSNAGV